MGKKKTNYRIVSAKVITDDRIKSIKTEYVYHIQKKIFFGLIWYYLQDPWCIGLKYVFDTLEQAENYLESITDKGKIQIIREIEVING